MNNAMGSPKIPCVTPEGIRGTGVTPIGAVGAPRSYLYLDRLPRPTNAASANLLQRRINWLSLAPIRECRKNLKAPCVLCGGDITAGDLYRDGGGPTKAHDLCFTEMTRRLRARGAENAG